jgi:hypothetical protein
MNQAMNDHLAQFVRGAQILTASAIFALVVAAIPTGLSLFKPPLPAETKIVGAVEISSPGRTTVRDDVTHLKEDLEKLKSSAREDREHIKRAEERIETLNGKLRRLQGTMPSRDGKTAVPGSSKP